MPRYGQIAIAGRPNAGKSSLLNAMLGTHLAIVSPKPQATRVPVDGLLTTGDTQMVLRDLPGLLDPRDLMQQRMRELAIETLASVDLVLFLWPAPDAPAPEFRALVPDAKPFRAPVLTVFTKSDLLVPARRAAFEADLAVVKPAPGDDAQPPSRAGVGAEGGGTRGSRASAGSGEPPSALISINHPASIERLIERVGRLLPVGQPQYPRDDLTTQQTRFFVEEYLREAAFDFLSDELPYAVTAQVDEFREEREPVYIRATLYVERESQKGMVIGKGGATLRRIGMQARQRIEALTGQPVYLDTWVKVLPHWRDRQASLARFGLAPVNPGEN